jgi:DNA repair protein RadD
MTISLTMPLRDYQQAAVDAALTHFRTSDQPAVITLPTGSGKSHVLAELARLAKHPVLILAHVKELVEQNHSKFEHDGFKAGIFAAGLGKKQDKFKTTFASVQSLSRNLQKFDGFYSLLIIDECHRVSLGEDSQYQKVITHLKKINPKLKVLGLTATPYRLDKGWIYKKHYQGFVRTEDETPFASCIYELPLRYLVQKGFLTTPTVIDAPVARYQFDDLPAEYNEVQLDQFLAKSPRVTQAICKQLIELATNRKGIMIFAASIKHAQEIYQQLPENQTAIVTGKTSTKERDKLIRQFKGREIKFLVNVSVLTTGFDAPHVDVIAILRRTDSVSLYQQIAGRGLRLAEGKTDCLIIDYAGNGYDLYQPEIGSTKPNSNSDLVQVPCPNCDFANLFWGITDADGDIIEHYGRRCQGLVQTSTGNEEQCHYRFKYKQCPHCNTENDIAARECHQCHVDLIDPDNQLKKALQLKDRKVLRCSGMSASLNEDKIRLCYHDEDGEEVKETFYFNNAKQKHRFLSIFSRTVTGQVIAVTTAEEVTASIHQFVAPDFVIAKKDKYFWKIEHRIFDYKGPYRKANQQ